MVLGGLLFQLSTKTLCFSELGLIYFGNVFFYAFVGNKIGSVARLEGSSAKWAAKNAMLLSGILLVNQIFIYLLVEFSFKVAFGCSAAHAWMSEIQTNHILPHVFIYAGIVFFHNYKAEKESAYEDEVSDDFIILKQNGKVVKVMHTEIVFVKSDNNAVTIHTTRGKFVAYQTLKSFHEELNSDRFKRVHKSYIVNKDQIASFQPKPSGDGLLVLEDGSNVKLSRNFKSQISLPFF